VYNNCDRLIQNNMRQVVRKISFLSSLNFAAANFGVFKQ